MKKACIICNITFDAQGKDLTCSKECSYQAQLIKNKKARFKKRNNPEERWVDNKIVKDCIVCGNEFEVWGSRKTCSNECSYVIRLDYNKKLRRHKYNNDPEYRENSKRKLKEYRKRNPEGHRASSSRWQRENVGKANAISAKRRAAKLKATPPWLSELDLFCIEEIYDKSQLLKELTGTEYHVDHIVPLQGKTVCGLHVPWNLQILTAEENISKSNKY